MRQCNTVVIMPIDLITFAKHFDAMAFLPSCIGGWKGEQSGVRCLFPIRVGFDGLCRWVEWDKVALGVFFSSGVG